MTTYIDDSLTLSRAGAPQKRIRKLHEASTTHEMTAAQLAVSVTTVLDIPLKSSARVRKIEVINDDLDSDATPTLVADLGITAGLDFDKTVSGTVTRVLKDAIIDADLLVDGSAASLTTLQAATTAWTNQTLAAACLSPTKADQALWEILGFDKDPMTVFNVAITPSAGAATAAAGTLTVRVEYVE
jgi:sensor domain CHASE-containing protein